MKIRSVTVFLPNAVLPLADWADCYEIEVAGRKLTAANAARRTVGSFPAWVRTLMAIRNRIVGVFGLKSSGVHMGTNLIGPFPVLEMCEGRAVLGFDDAHLDFRIVIDVRDEAGNSQVVGVTTLVWRKIFLGRIYIAIVTPFHRLIVKAMLSGLGRSSVAR